ncbi:protein TolR [Thalassotalea agarivorans]|uniref:Tol-Pal system protein TolR n=1 Tax=Thalassotalea agarivorans TaxID=349064 RepID=A0A1I0GVZ5_THASX|nr:protein TolR [Thalassotalea agarivorans]SET74684.1 Cell division and transport-associated protein TolR [Thalassotalea agarivorans]
MAIYYRKRRRKVAEINVVPYIDVMLVLLIIFMVTAPIIAQGVKVDLPEADAETLPQDSKPPIVATVDVDGNYYLSINDVKSSPLNDEDIKIRVAAHLENRPDTPVVINGDGSVPYDEVVRLMVILQEAGVPSVGLMTDSPEK